METVAVAALKSLDSDTFTRASPDHVLPGTIKLTEETLSRLAHLLKSGCSIQLACDEVAASSISRFTSRSCLMRASSSSNFRLAFLELPFTAGSTAHGLKMRRIYTMSAREIIFAGSNFLIHFRFAAVLAQTRAQRSEQFLESTVTRAYSQ